MSYEIGFKEEWVKRALNRGTKSFISVAREAGIPEQTLRYWIKSAAAGTLGKESQYKANKPSSQSNRQKFKLIIESRTIPEEKRGEWLRRNGLHSQTLTQYEQEITDLIETKANNDKKIIRDLRKENKLLEKELKKKEKALAEMAELYTLKKKAEKLWGELEEG